MAVLHHILSWCKKIHWVMVSQVRTHCLYKHKHHRAIKLYTVLLTLSQCNEWKHPSSNSKPPLPAEESDDRTIIPLTAMWAAAENWFHAVLKCVWMNDLWRWVVFQVAGFALFAGVSVQAEETLFQGHFQLLFVGMRVIFGRGCQLFFQNSNLHHR